MTDSTTIEPTGSVRAEVVVPVRWAAICRSFTFDAAHQLPHHHGKCARLHGHTYRVEVELAGEVRPADGDSAEGMVRDFADVKQAWRLLNDRFDHHNLNDVVPPAFQPTTAENLAAYIFHVLGAQLPEVAAVRVWETASSWAEVRR